jgi:hypothetical protein
MQKSIFPQKFKKVCVLQRRACNNFKRNYLENYNDSEHAVKTKNAPFFMIFPNISFFHMVVNYWTGPLNLIRAGKGSEVKGVGVVNGWSGEPSPQVPEKSFFRIKFFS